MRTSIFLAYALIRGARRGSAISARAPFSWREPPGSREFINPARADRRLPARCVRPLRYGLAEAIADGRDLAVREARFENCDCPIASCPTPPAPRARPHHAALARRADLAVHVPGPITPSRCSGKFDRVLRRDRRSASSRSASVRECVAEVA